MEPVLPRRSHSCSCRRRTELIWVAQGLISLLDCARTARSGVISPPPGLRAQNSAVSCGPGECWAELWWRTSPRPNRVGNVRSGCVPISWSLALLGGPQVPLSELRAQQGVCPDRQIGQRTESAVDGQRRRWPSGLRPSDGHPDTTERWKTGRARPSRAAAVACADGAGNYFLRLGSSSGLT